jgi:hypothetical protein
MNGGPTLPPVSRENGSTILAGTSDNPGHKTFVTLSVD